MPKENKAEKAIVEEALPEIMMRVVSELHDVAYLIERIEPQLLELGGTNVLEHPDSIKVLQGIDLAVQKARGLAEFIDTITGFFAVMGICLLASLVSIRRALKVDPAEAVGG